MKPGLIGIPQADLARYSYFQQCMDALQYPAGSGIQRVTGENIAKNVNVLCTTMLNQPEYDWLWIIADDHIFNPDILVNLIKRDVDVVAPLYTMRRHPFAPTYHSGADDYKQMTYEALKGKQGLVELKSDTIGDSGMLIKRKVLEKMPEPWFEYGKPKPLMMEDLWFCEKVRHEGFKLYIDLDNVMGHIGNCVIWPMHDKEGNWHPQIKTL